MVKAVDQFNLNRGVKFNTYATHVINGHLRHYLRDLGKIIKEPAWMQEARHQVNRAVEELAQETGQPPTSQEVAKHIGMKQKTVDQVLNAREIFKVESLDGVGNSEGGSGSTELEHILIDGDLSEQISMEDKIAVRDAMGKLSQVQRAVIYYAFYQEYSKSEIAKLLGLSANYVGCIVRRALGHLKDLLSREQEAASKVMTKVTGPGNVELTESNQQLWLDPMTGFMAAWYFRQRFEVEVERASRYEMKLALACFVLPQLENIEDKISGGSNRAMLAMIGTVVCNNFRRIDFVGRLNHSEFLVALPHTDHVASIPFARLREKLQEVFIPALGLQEGLILRYGVVFCPDDGERADELLDAARSLAFEVPLGEESC